MRVAVPCHAFCRHETLRAELLEACADVRFNDDFLRFNEAGLIGFLDGCDAAIIAMEQISDGVLSALPDLKVIGKYGVGLDNIDAAAMQNHNVRLGWTPGTNALSVAELVLCFAIAALRHVGATNAAMRAGDRPAARLGRHLSGRVVGIHGCGHVGKQLARLLAPFTCTILACDIADYGDFYKQHGITPVGFDELIERSEILTLHLPLTRATRGLYDADILSRLRDDCILINTCRGGIVDEGALKEKLTSGAIAAACFDVFAAEPPTDDALLSLPNFLATPHLGGSAEEARLAMGRSAIRGLFENSVPTPGKTPFED
jgi:D-3-phosphoglycerate dehydrogenase